MLARNEEKCHTTLKVAIYLDFDMHSTPGGCAIKVAIYLGFDMHSTPGGCAVTVCPVTHGSNVGPSVKWVSSGWIIRHRLSSVEFIFGGRVR